MTRMKYHQVGKSDYISDYARDALPPGKRRSKSRKAYWETRKNRTDMPHKKV
jgi:hypothetical protein